MSETIYVEQATLSEELRQYFGGALRNGGLSLLELPVELGEARWVIAQGKERVGCYEVRPERRRIRRGCLGEEWARRRP
jgi:hypothetical protein